MNVYMKMQIANAIAFTDSFLSSCELAAIKDDGVISKQEAKELKQIKNAAEEFRRKLEKIH